MDKVAFFVEGQTELLFIDRLLHTLAPGLGLAVEHAEARGGASGARRVKVFKQVHLRPEQKIYVLIVNCSGDGNVKSDIRDRYYGLVQAGYKAILGLRDVYGAFRLPQVPKLRTFLEMDIPREPIQVQFILAIMEIEAWFLGEYTHFARLDARLTPQYVRGLLGFDPAHEDLTSREHPADDLNRVYHLVGHGYDKHRRNVQRTVDLLDYNFLQTSVARRFSDLQRLFGLLDELLGSRRQ